MAELVLELFSEEIPARMQVRAAEDLRRLVLAGLEAAGVSGVEASAYVTPRRLVLHIADLPNVTEATREERKGPRVGSPDKAVEGFLRGAGLASLDDAEIRTDPKKGDFYVAVIARDGVAMPDVLAEIIPDVVRNFSWPKSMRWGDGNLRWVRPLQRIVCVLDGTVVPFEIDGIASGNISSGHRFMGPDEFEVAFFEQYAADLERQFVHLSTEARMDRIRSQAEALAKRHKLALVEDEVLVAENAGLNEWPTVLMGSFDDAFLDVPDRVLTTAMKEHQKCFSLTDKSGALAAKFLMVTNIEAADGGKQIIAGNERVINARLSDAKFFWDNDVKTPLSDMAAKLSEVTFHEKLGTQAERVERIAALAREIAPKVGADADSAEAAARLVKADLMSETVYETPELQGYAGRHLAVVQGQPDAIAAACDEHYKPVGASDDVPTEPVSMAVALADKLDMLVSFWAIDEKPTGSGDPFALRRSALGVIRIVLENRLSLQLMTVAVPHYDVLRNYSPDGAAFASNYEHPKGLYLSNDLMGFLMDRLEVSLRDQGAKHDLIKAVRARWRLHDNSHDDDLLMVVERVEALGSFLETDDGENLLAGVKRAANILRIEEKKDKTSYEGAINTKLLKESAEKELAKSIAAVSKDASARIAKEDFEGAMAVLAKLRGPVDAFFDEVKVNDDDAKVRVNRLNLLASIREATRQVADFSKIAG